MNSHLDLLALARDAAAAAARYVADAGRPDPSAWDLKGLNDFVTGVDRGAEDLIREILLSGEPGSTVVGEEGSPDPVAARSGLAWIVDPLDGTTNFLHGYPMYAVSIGVAVDGTVVAGVVRDVPRNREYRAAAGHGAWEGGARLTVSPIAEPARSLLGTGFPFKNPDRLEEYLVQFRHLMSRTSGIRRAGSAALDLADVAAGRLDGFWELELAPWDTAAGSILVQEAGGRITDLAGAPLRIAPGAVVAGNPTIHAWLLAALG